MVVGLFCNTICGHASFESSGIPLELSGLIQMHLHGHDFLLLAEGKGVFNESVLQSANLVNPTRRDVVTMPASDPTASDTGGFVVIAFPLNNPGVWVFLHYIPC